MKILIDTHIFLWCLSDPDKLKNMYAREIESFANIIYVSAVSITEIMIKASIGKLDINFNPVEMVKETGFELLPFRGEDALPLKEMPFHHKDPFDRMLIAQSIQNKLTLMSDDKKFRKYDCRLL
jgi:PIN domain nuclease of toxin-antitoxin system